MEAINKWDMHPYLNTNQLNTITIMVMKFSACQVANLKKNIYTKYGAVGGVGGSGVRLKNKKKCKDRGTRQGEDQNPMSSVCVL